MANHPLIWFAEESEAASGYRGLIVCVGGGVGGLSDTWAATS